MGPDDLVAAAASSRRHTITRGQGDTGTGRHGDRETWGQLRAPIAARGQMCNEKKKL